MKQMTFHVDPVLVLLGAAGTIGENRWGHKQGADDYREG
jgi:hypothetical protein